MRGGDLLAVVREELGRTRSETRALLDRLELFYFMLAFFVLLVGIARDFHFLAELLCAPSCAWLASLRALCNAGWDQFTARKFC